MSPAFYPNGISARDTGCVWCQYNILMFPPCVCHLGVACVKTAAFARSVYSFWLIILFMHCSLHLYFVHLQAKAFRIENQGQEPGNR